MVAQAFLRSRCSTGPVGFRARRDEDAGALLPRRWTPGAQDPSRHQPSEPELPAPCGSRRTAPTMRPWEDGVGWARGPGRKAAAWTDAPQ